MNLEHLITVLLKQIEWTSKLDEEDFITLRNTVLTAYVFKQDLDTLLCEWKESVLVIDNTELIDSLKDLNK